MPIQKYNKLNFVNFDIKKKEKSIYEKNQLKRAKNKYD